jgi:hypothetical protein
VDAGELGFRRCTGLELLDPGQLGLQGWGASPDDPVPVSHQGIYRDAAGVALRDEALPDRIPDVGVNLGINPRDLVFLRQGEKTGHARGILDRGRIPQPCSPRCRCR